MEEFLLEKGFYIEALNDFINEIKSVINTNGNIEDVDDLLYVVENKKMMCTSHVLSKEEIQSKGKDFFYIFRDNKADVPIHLKNGNDGGNFLVIEQNSDGEDVYAEIIIEEIKDRIRYTINSTSEVVEEAMNYNEQEQIILDEFDSIKLIIKNVFGKIFKIPEKSPVIGIFEDFGLISVDSKRILCSGREESVGELIKIIEKFDISSFNNYDTIFSDIITDLGFEEKKISIFALKCREEKIMSGLKLKLGELMKELQEIVAENDKS